MNNKSLKKLARFIIPIVFISLNSCNDTFDDHYNPEVAQADQNSLYDVLGTLEDYGEFFNAINEYPELVEELQRDFPITVFVPTNESFLSATQGLDTEGLLSFIQFHMVYGPFKTSDLRDERLVMLNGKFVNARAQGEGFVLGEEVNINMNLVNLPSNNGVIHTLEGALVERPSLYEFLYDNFPILQEFFDEQIVRVIDFENSVPTGEFTEDGLAILDTVFVDVNPFENELGAGEQEFTVIVPTGEIVTQTIQNDVSSFFAGTIPDNINEGIIESILSNSIFPGVFSYTDLVEDNEIISNADLPITIDTTQIVTRDIRLSNGVLHVTGGFELDQSSYLQELDINIFDGLTNETLDFTLSDESYRLRLISGQEIVIYETEEIGDYFEFQTPDSLLSTTYSVVFSPGSGFRSTIIELSVDGTLIGEPFDYQPIGTGEQEIGQITFSDYRSHTVRFTISDIGNDADDNFFRLKYVTFIPISQ